MHFPPASLTSPSTHTHSGVQIPVAPPQRMGCPSSSQVFGPQYAHSTDISSSLQAGVDRFTTVRYRTWVRYGNPKHDTPYVNILTVSIQRLFMFILNLRLSNQLPHTFMPDLLLTYILSIAVKGVCT